MFVKLNLLVICAVLLNFGDCNNCDDVFKCVNNWVAAAISPNSNITVEIIDDVATKDPPSNTSLVGNLLTDLTNFLADQFSNLIKENFSLNVLENKTNIYVQTFSVFENESNIKSTILKSDLIDDNIQNAKLMIQDENTTPAEDTTTPIINNNDVGHITEINNVYNATVTIKPMTMAIDDKTNIITNNNSYGNGHNITNNIHLEYSTYETNYRNKQDETTTSIFLNIEDVKKTNDFFGLTTDKILITDVTTMKQEMIENNNSDANSLSKTNNIPLQELSVDVNKDDSILKIKINNNYIDDVYDFHGDNEIDINELVPDNLTDYLDIDYTDFYKDTTNEEAEYTSTVYIPTTTEAVKHIIDKKPTDGVDSVYPWIATVFIMNSESKQFEYICDGSLLSERVVLTAARCVMKANVTVDVTNILIILGKRSLQAMGPNETVLRVNSIKVHDKFDSIEGKVENDLAIVVLAEPVLFNDDVRPAPLGVEDKSVPLATATTGWHVSGPLQPLYLEPKSSENCMAHSKNYLCATLSDDETTCPSFGGLLIDRQDDNQWRLKGIASGSPTSAGVCFNKHLVFTKLGNYLDWIMKHVKDASNNK